MRRTALCLLLAALAPIDAWADARTEAQSLVERAVASYRARRYAEAAELYLEAHRVVEAGKLRSKPELLYNAALAFDDAGLCDRAADLYDRFLAARPAAGSARELVRRAGEARACAPQVTITTEPPGASVTIDDAPRGTTPVSLRLRAGVHRIAFVLADHQTQEETFTVERGAAASIARVLAPIAPVVEAAPEPAPAPPVVAQAPAAARVEVAVPERGGPPVIAWAAGGAGVAALAAGVVLRLLSSAAVGDYEDELAIQLARPSAERESRKVRELEDEAVALEAASNVSLGLAAAGLVAAAVVWVLDDDAPLAVSSGGAGVVLAW